jgi:hypothetical protein
MTSDEDVERLQKADLHPPWKADRDPFDEGISALPTNRFLSVCIIASAVFVMYTFLVLFLSSFSAVNGLAVARQASTSTVPQWFQTTPELFAGETNSQIYHCRQSTDADVQQRAHTNRCSSFSSTD